MKKLFVLFSLFLTGTILSAQPKTSTEDSALVEVIVKDYKDKIRVHDRILFIGKTKKVTLEGLTNEKGSFRILIPEGEEFDVVIKGLGENQDYNTFSVPKIAGRYGVATLNIKYEPPKSFMLKNLQFESGKATIKVGSEKILNELIELLQLKPAMTIEIAGHTDDVGEEEANMILSQNRAESVKKYVITKGKIAPERIKAVGYGETQPIADNTTQEGRQKNRRTQVLITSE